MCRHQANQKQDVHPRLQVYVFADRSLLSHATSLLWKNKSKKHCRWLEHWFICHLSCLHREQRSPWRCENIVFLPKVFHLIKDGCYLMSTMPFLWYCTVSSKWLESAVKTKQIQSLLLSSYNLNKNKIGNAVTPLIHPQSCTSRVTDGICTVDTVLKHDVCIALTSWVFSFCHLVRYNPDPSPTNLRGV